MNKSRHYTWSLNLLHVQCFLDSNQWTGSSQITVVHHEKTATVIEAGSMNLLGSSGVSYYLSVGHAYQSQ